MVRSAAAVVLVLKGLAGALVILAGCTPMQWERPGTGEPLAESDYQACRAWTTEKAWRLAWNERFWPRERIARDRHGRLTIIRDPFWGPFGWGPYPDRCSLEQDLTSDCLRAKGYRLVPAGPRF